MATKVLVMLVIAMATRSHAHPDNACKEQGSCDSKINQTSFGMNCGCDKSCVAIGDCCFDYVNNGDRLQPIETKAECVSMPLIKGTAMIEIPMVQKCPPNFEDVYVKKRCETLRQNLPFTAGKIANDFSFYVPVLGKMSQVLFANIYCAVCNGEQESTFLDVDFQNRRPMPLEKLLKMKNLKKFNSVFPRTRVVMSHGGYTPRPCRVSVDKCDALWAEDDTSVLCRESATSYVYNRNDVTTYKNKYCAKCNYMAEEDITCYDPRKYLSSGRGIVLYPYSLLFDLNTGTIVSREARSSSIMEVTDMHQKEQFCPSNEVYDPFHRACLDLLCPKEQMHCKHYQQLTQNKLQDLKDDYSLGPEDNLNVSDTTIPCGTPLSLLHKMRMSTNISIALLDQAILCTNASWNGSPNAQALDQVNASYLGYPATYLTVVFNAFSIAGLLAHIVIYGMFQSLRNTPGKCLMCLSFCLMVFQLLFTLALGQTAIRILCFAIALILHYTSLSYFFWMTVLSFDIWHTFHMHARSAAQVSKDNETTFQRYSLFAFGVPVIMVTVSAVMDSFDFKVRPHYAEGQCWFSQQDGLLYYFDVPVAVTLATNTTFLLLTIRNLINVSRNTKIARSQSSRKEKHRFFLYVKLSLVMGVTYITAFVAMATKRWEIWYIFIILNSLQGVWIFLSFVCTRKVFRLICESCGEKMGISQIFDRNSRSKNSYSTKQTGLRESTTIQESEKLTVIKEEESAKR